MFIWVKEVDDSLHHEVQNTSSTIEAWLVSTVALIKLGFMKL